MSDVRAILAKLVENLDEHRVGIGGKLDCHVCNQLIQQAKQALAGATSTGEAEHGS